MNFEKPDFNLGPLIRDVKEKLCLNPCNALQGLIALVFGLRQHAIGRILALTKAGHLQGEIV